MHEEFQAPRNSDNTYRNYPSVQLGNLDRIIGIIIAAIVVGAIAWLGTAIENVRNVSVNSQVEIGKLQVQISSFNDKLDSINKQRDLNLLIMENRLKNLEDKISKEN